MKLIASLILIVKWLENTDSRSVSKYIAEVGDTVTIYCPEKSQNSVTWHGPQDYFPYSEDDQINHELIIKNIVMVGNHSKGEYNLEILNVSYANQGNYRCRVLNSRAKEYDILLVIKDKPSTVKEITDNDVPKETHKVTNYPGNPLQNTKAQNEYSYNNLNVSIQNKGCTNEFHFIIVCIASFVVVIVIVTLLGIVLSQYYKTKYRKQSLPEIEITNDYEEIDSTNGDLTQDANGDLTQDEHIIINPRQESNIQAIRIEEKNRPLDATFIDRNASKCLTQTMDEENLHTTYWQSAIDYENNTFTCYNDEKDPDDYLHPYVGLGPEDYISPYQSLQLQQSNTKK